MYKQTISENILYSTGNSPLYSVITYRGQESPKEGTYVYVELVHFSPQQKLTQHCKAIIL